MRSIISASGQLIDRRKLCLYSTGFLLSAQQVDELTARFYQFTSDQFRECVLLWDCGGRSVKWSRERLGLRKLANGAFILEVRGNVKCEQIYNKTTFLRKRREIEYPKLPHPLAGEDASVDYLQHSQAQMTAAAIQSLFDLEGKVDLGESVAPDVHGLFICVPIEHHSDRFYVKLHLWVPVYCLDGQIDQAADSFLQFGKALSLTAPNINISIDLNPMWERYSYYFGRNDRIGSNFATKGFTLTRQYLSCLYLMEPGWAHILCPMTRALCMHRETETENLEYHEHGDGGLLLCGRNAISELTVSDRKRIKQCLYTAILPRSGFTDWNKPLRPFWEEIPVFKDEIATDPHGVTFTHHGTINWSYVSGVFGIENPLG